MKFVFNDNVNINPVTENVTESIMPISNEIEVEVNDNIDEEELDFNKTLAFLNGDCSIRQLLACIRKIDIVAELTTFGNDSDCSINLNYLGKDKQIDSYVDEVDNVRYIVTDYDKVSSDLFCLILGYLYGSGEMVNNLSEDKNTIKVIMVTNQEQLRQLMTSKKGGSNIEQRKK